MNRLAPVLAGVTVLAAGCAHPPPPVGRTASPPPPRPPVVRTFRLAPGTPQERRLAGGQIDAYEIDLPDDTYLHATFEQRGVDLAVQVFAPGARRWMRVDSPNGAEGPEEIHLLTEGGGRYRLELAALPGKPPGNYLPILRGVRRPSVTDRLQATADRAFYEARELDSVDTGFWEAMAKYERAALLFGEAGDRWHQAYAFFRLGKLDASRGRHREALDFYTRAGRLFAALHDDHFRAAAHSDSGLCYAGLADFDRAGAELAEALALARQTGDRREQAVILHDQGNLLQLRGHAIEALAAFRTSLSLWESQGESGRAGAATTLTGIGWTYDSLGDSRRAIAAQWRALRLRNQLGDRRQQAISLTQLGNAFLADAPERALPFFERALALERVGGDLPEQTVTLNGIGLALRQLGRYAEARATYLWALKLYGAPPDLYGQAATWTNLGWATVRLGQPGPALDAFERGLRLARELHDPTAQARALLGMAEGERERGNLILAQARAESALGIFETLRADIARPDLQTSYLAANENAFGVLIRILMERHRAEPWSGYDLAAWERSEQARARSLLDTLSDAREERANRQAGVSPERLAERRRLLVEIGVRDAERRRTGADAAAASSAEQALSRAIEALSELDASILREARRSAAPPRFSPATLAQLRRQLLDPDTILLEYYLASPKSYLFAVSADSVQSFELPGNEVLEPLLRTVSAELAAPPIPGSSAGADGALALYRLLLEPVARRLSGKRLLIAADGAAQYLPFAALPDPAEGSGPLSLYHEVVFIPSLAALGELRERRAARPPPPHTLALLGDPVFDAADERLPTGGPARANAAPPDDFLPRLPRTRTEVEAIAALVPVRDRLVALDFAASRELVTRGTLRPYGVLHFATHGVLRIDHPELSALILSRVDPRGEPRDGALRVPDIAGLALPADLVVLSACSTALGRETPGEGLVGLPQAFFTAGASRVLVSLWQVEDAATTALMTHFYRHLIVDHLPPARALQSAQAAIRGQPRWRSPRYWAGFVLQGDWQ